MKMLRKAAAVIAVLCAVSAGMPAIAQAGGAGGTIGNQDKSLSGGEESVRSVPHAAAPVRRETHHAAARSNSFDGIWTSVAIGETCNGSVQGVATITNGHIFGQGTSGTVSSSGAARAVVVGGGMTAVATGHFAGNSGSGRWKRSDGCTGRWTMVRQ